MAASPQRGDGDAYSKIADEVDRHRLLRRDDLPRYHQMLNRLEECKTYVAQSLVAPPGQRGLFTSIARRRGETVTHTLGFRFPAEVDDEAAMNKVRELMPYALAKGYMFYPLVLIKAKELVLACPELDPSWLINVAHPSPPANANVKWIEVRRSGSSSGRERGEGQQHHMEVAIIATRDIKAGEELLIATYDPDKDEVETTARGYEL
ncbi:unnamed protein product [Vitrella brassicaformis CCMP3155]|uniref:SET domain-containing protein n=1 Tax=Vitrella brassicaformis (strain CCMP3155) TaxID=1169540 RepID=A0A0G4E9F7_VITBC|nr:unnamed protein product [Vitrella brassicaformis CCMP3155]|eukprot:CEL92017.1 unnamed protein product [Vitrella brassicaformis CCMP3155]